jgi:hypothetical protein
VISRTGQVLRSWKLDWKLSAVLPDGKASVWKAGGFPAADLHVDSVIAIRVVNPLPGGKPLRFANATQDQHAPGWLTLGPNPGP